jgi:hypothetical protein
MAVGPNSSSEPAMPAAVDGSSGTMPAVGEEDVDAGSAAGGRQGRVGGPVLRNCSHAGRVEEE